MIFNFNFRKIQAERETLFIAPHPHRGALPSGDRYFPFPGEKIDLLFCTGGPVTLRMAGVFYSLGYVQPILPI
jgi:hypothetical protein